MQDHASTLKLQQQWQQQGTTSSEVQKFSKYNEQMGTTEEAHITPNTKASHRNNNKNKIFSMRQELSTDQ